MTETIRERIHSGPRTELQLSVVAVVVAYERGNLIPRDEHETAIAAAERRGMERAAVICDEMVNHDAWDCAAAIRADLEDKE